MVVSQREKVEDGVRYRLNENSRWVRVDGQDPRMKVKTDNIKPEQPKDKVPPKSKPLGQNSMAPPWNYDGVKAYFQAYAVSRPKTTAGKYFFNVVNTANWLKDSERAKSLQKLQEEERKAVEKGFERAMQQFDELAGKPNPSDGFREMRADDIRATLKGLRAQLESMEEQRKQYKGDKSPEALQFMSEYATYKNLHDLMVSTAKEYNRNVRSENNRTQGDAREQARVRSQQDAHERARRRARDLRERAKRP